HARRLEDIAAVSKTKGQAPNKSTVDLAKIRNGNPPDIAALKGQPPGASGAACTGGRVKAGNQCQCPTGAVANERGVCIPAREAALSRAPGKPGAPKCVGGRVPVGNQCQCPPGAAAKGNGP